jgi:hypothetical protein
MDAAVQLASRKTVLGLALAGSFDFSLRSEE